MAFLGAAVRWPDALLGKDGATFTEACDEIASHLRVYLPRPFNTLSSHLLVSLFFTWVLIISFTAFSALLNQRRASLVPAAAHSASATAAAAGGTSRKRKPGQAVTTLLIGPEQTGKSALYSAFVFGAVPDTQTSQHENETKTLVRVGASTSAEAEKDLSPQQQLIHLVDLPGHPRLRGKVNDYLPSAQRIVFCIDTASAIKGGTSKNDTLIEAVDHLHATLTTLAKARLSSRTSSAYKSKPPPSLLILFTRGDLSPLLSSNAHDPKRQSQVLTRARTALEAELGRRRAGMGLGRNSNARTRVGGMSKVVSDSSSGGSGAAASGFLSFLKSLVGLGGSSSSGSSAANGAGADDEDEEEDEEGLDYVDWAWAQRVASAAGGPGASSGSTSSSTSFSLDKLDAEVVTDGKAHFAVASLGKERGWAVVGDQTASEEKSSATADLFPGLSSFSEWLVDPNV